MPGPPREPRGTPPICKSQNTLGWIKLFHSVSEAQRERERENEQCLQMALEWVWGEARRLATFLRRHWLEPSATELWTRQGSLLQVGYRKQLHPLSKSRKTHPWKYNPILSKSIFALTSRLDFQRTVYKIAWYYIKKKKTVTRHTAKILSPELFLSHEPNVSKHTAGCPGELLSIFISCFMNKRLTSTGLL